MKKMLRMLAFVLALALLAASGAAFAEVDVISGNISNGGVAAVDGQGRLWYAMDGLMRVESDGSRSRVMDGSARFLQAAGNNIYFVLREEAEPENENGYNDTYVESLWTVGADDIPVQIGDARPVAEYSQYGDEDYHLTNATRYNGYGDMTVYGDHIYFIGTDTTAGTYITNAANWGEGYDEVETAYDGQAAVYRMDLDGENLTALITGLGNGEAHMAIANERIAVASCFRNAVFAYDFSNFMLYDMDGGFVSATPNTTEGRHEGIYKEEEEFTVIVSSIQTDGERIYASLCDSEGDFMSSRLVDVADPDATIAIEVFYAGSLVTDRGIFYITADVQDTYWQEDMEYTVALYHRAPDGTDTLLAHIPYNYVGYDMRLTLLGDELYVGLRNNLSAYMDATIERVNPNDGVLLRVKLENGAVDELTEGGFVVSMACDPEYYTPPVLAWQQGEDAELASELNEMDETDSYLLPDSDVYLYAAEELQDYDKDTLALMRNEILARHGYVFKKEVYRDYFSGKSWYSENADFEYGDLNAVEMENVETIKKLEEKK